ncbi:MAG: PCMD domain-containing protein, partial [Muribaculaceae bacterium]|nr:PCMD domain-containing protein [Muribaculaceae bacterium]
MIKCLFLVLTAISCMGLAAQAETVEPIKYGDMNSWVTRNIKESRLLGGDTRQVYAIGPERIINGDEAYTPLGGSPWGSSNVMANVMGIVKTSNAVFPEKRTDSDRACRMSTIIESCKVIGMINIKVLVSGSIFLGQMLEPIRSTSNPYSKMEMGIPFNKRPKALQLDYKMVNPGTGILTYCNGSKPKESKGEDQSEVFIILQRRWEDADGNLYAKRVGTGRERFSKSTDGWVNKHRIPVHYGDITSMPDYKSYMGLIPEERCYYARNSKGKMVPVHEIGWDNADATPTHMLIMASSGAGTAYVGTVGMDLC